LPIRLLLTIGEMLSLFLILNRDMLEKGSLELINFVNGYHIQKKTSLVSHSSHNILSKSNFSKYLEYWRFR
jgi:hypothetical protein